MVTSLGSNECGRCPLRWLGMDLHTWMGPLHASYTVGGHWGELARTATRAIQSTRPRLGSYGSCTHDAIHTCRMDHMYFLIHTHFSLSHCKLQWLWLQSLALHCVALREDGWGGVWVAVEGEARTFSKQHSWVGEWGMSQRRETREEWGMLGKGWVFLSSEMLASCLFSGFNVGFWVCGPRTGDSWRTEKRRWRCCSAEAQHRNGLNNIRMWLSLARNSVCWQVIVIFAQCSSSRTLKWNSFSPLFSCFPPARFSATPPWWRTIWPLHSWLCAHCCVPLNYLNYI